MVITLTILFGAFGFIYYKSKDELSIVESDTLDSQKVLTEEDDLYKNLEDLFI